jgi:hypothetical protein
LRNRGSRHKRQSVAVGSQSHTLKFVNNDFEIEVKECLEIKKKLKRLLKKQGKPLAKAFEKAPEL